MAFGKTQSSKRTSQSVYRVTHLLASLLFGLVIWEAVWIASGGSGFHHFWELGSFFLASVTSLTFAVMIGWTVTLTIAGLAAGLVVALMVGAIVASSRFFELSTRSSLYFLRAIPSVAILPLLMASLGSRTLIVILLVTWLVSIKLVLFVIRGLLDLDKGLDDQARLLNLGGIKRAFLVQLPSASGHIAMGVRMTVSRAYGAVILAGLLAGTPGLGSAISLARINGDSEALLGYAVVAGLIGLVLFGMFGQLERSVVKWRPTQ